MAADFTPIASLRGRSNYFVFAIAILFLATPESYAIHLATSTFDLNDEGWRVVGDSQSVLPTFVASGGNPGGFLRGFDQTVGGVWLWTAPAKFLGNMSAAYGFALTYDLRMRGSGPLFDDSDVVLTSPGLSLYRQLTPPVPQDVPWTSYSAQIDPSAGWHTGTLSGPLATETQIKTVLGNLTGLAIRGEFISGSDNGDIDNVVLNGALLGDYNLNGVVDAPDYVVWRNGLGTIYTQPDYDVWRAHFGQTAPALATAAATHVPEPASLALLIIAACFAAIRRTSLAPRPDC